jgi:predicted glycosyltransferase
VLRAYESNAVLPYPALLVLGPFMQPERQTDFMERAGRLERVEAITFDPHLEILENNAAGVVSMGGYNTFCEVLSMDKRAIMVPRTVPRREQYIRVSRAEELGMVRMLVDDGKFDARTMADALRALPSQKLPSDIIVPGLLEGLVNVNRLIEPWITQAEQGPTQTVVPHRA